MKQNYTYTQEEELETRSPEDDEIYQTFWYQVNVKDAPLA